MATKHVHHYDDEAANPEATQPSRPKLSGKAYEKELLRLQSELVTMQQWVKDTGNRVVVIFEGRDAAGKGGAIKRITEPLNPRLVRVAALPAPSDRQKSQWYFQRYVEHLPAAGEIVLFDRSWYNRAGVEHVMGFCDDVEYERFLRQAPVFEQMLIDDGIMLRKYWFSVSDVEQERRFKSRAEDPDRRWKLSPMDLESITRWEDYSRAKDRMFAHTDLPNSPWNVVESDDKKRARLNVINHLLQSIPYLHMQAPKIEIPSRPHAESYVRPPRDSQRYVPDVASNLVDEKSKKSKKSNGGSKADKATDKNPDKTTKGEAAPTKAPVKAPTKAADAPTEAAGTPAAPRSTRSRTVTARASRTSTTRSPRAGSK